jgi:hypothetical protein
MNGILCFDVVCTLLDFAQGQLEADWVASSGRLLESWPSYNVDNPWAGITRVCKMWHGAAATVGFSGRRYIAARHWSTEHSVYGTAANVAGQMYHWSYSKGPDMDIDWDIFHYIKGGKDGGHIVYNIYSDGPNSVYLVVTNAPRIYYGSKTIVPTLAPGKYPAVYRTVPGLVRFLKRGKRTAMIDDDFWHYGRAPAKLVADIARVLMPEN